MRKLVSIHAIKNRIPVVRRNFLWERLVAACSNERLSLAQLLGAMTAAFSLLCLEILAFGGNFHIASFNHDSP